MHAQDKPFRCDQPDCTFASVQSSDVMVHKATVHSLDRPFKCDFPGCDYACAVKSHLNKHRRKVHELGDVKASK